jgi:predicted Rossmann fold nucleotide-binding protein DprA/Smf involved in DNA uptake
MSSYGKQVIGLLITNFKLRITNLEIVTIRVSGCNTEVIRLGAKKIFSGDNFEKLNEEVAEYADCLVIVEGGEKSGTLLLAEKFVEKGKTVYCVPGRITDGGSFAPNWLIAQGATPLIDIIL